MKQRLVRAFLADALPGIVGLLTMQWGILWCLSAMALAELALILVRLGIGTFGY